MRPHLLPILFLLACASCQREEKAARAASGPAPAPAKQAERSTIPPDPIDQKPLLNTPRIWISAIGSASSLKGDVATNAADMIADLNTLPPSSSRDSVYQSVISQLSKSDPAQARIFLKEWKGLAGNWSKAAQEIVRQLAKSQPAEVTDFITKDVPPGLQIEVWAAYIQTLSPEERPAVLDTLPESREKLYIIGSLIRDWVVTDPAALAAWLDQNPPGNDSSERQALESLRGIFNPAANEPTLWLAAFHAAKTPEAQRFFAENALRLANPEQRAQWRIDLAAAVPGLNDGSDKHPWSDDPAAWTANLAESDIANMPAENAEELIRSWGQKNPRKALEWALAHNRPEAAQALDLLYYQEPKEAVAMAPNLEAGPARDAVLSTICSVAAHFGDTHAAQTLLPLISDPKRQELTRRQVEESLARKKR